MNVGGLCTQPKSDEEERGDGRLNEKMRTVLDDTDLQSGQNGLSAHQRQAAREDNWDTPDDERDLRAELHEYYEEYNQLERKRLRLIFCVQRHVLSKGCSNVDSGTLVMILNLAK